MITSLNNLKSELEASFDVKLFSDLGELSTTPTGLFKVLDAVYQNEYSPNDRIVFYTSWVPPQQFFQHLYHTSNFLDISNWFILICGPAEIKNLITESCESFSSDKVPYQFLETKIKPTRPFENGFVLPNTICAFPWSNLEIEQDGNITPCCMTTGLSFGNIKDTTLKEAFYSSTATKLREDFLDGRKPNVCQNCWRVEEKNLTSIRTHNIDRLKRDFLLKNLDDPQITTLDIKFNNTCNFKCRICSSYSSSAFAQESHKFFGTPLVVQDNWGESKNFIDQVAELLPNIINIDMYGGEPLLIKKFKKVLEIAVDQGHSKNIRLHYNSNGSIWPEELLNYWPHFKMVDILFSIDDLGARFELQRGGIWADVEKNILKLKELNLPNLSINIMPTISTMNIYYLDQLYNWATKHNFQLVVSHARGTGFGLDCLTKQAKDMIIEKFKNHPWHELQNILEIIRSLPDNDGKEFCHRIHQFDAIRNENFAESHPEIAKAMGYVYNKDL